MIKRIILILFYFTILFSILCFFACDNNKNDSQNSRIEHTTYDPKAEFKWGMTISQCHKYTRFFYLHSKNNGTYENIRKGEFYMNDATDKVVVILNWLAWEEKTDDDEYNKVLLQYRNVMESYGFSSDNKITSKWVLDNPKLAYDLIINIPERIYNWLDRNSIRDLYYNYIFGENRSAEMTICGLTLQEIAELVDFYEINTKNQCLFRLDPNEQIIFEQVITPEGKHVSQMSIDLFNYMVWDFEEYSSDQVDKQQNAKEIFNAYGFTSENRITVDWVVNNPVNAYQLYKEMPENITYDINIFLYSKYDKYLGDKE